MEKEHECEEGAGSNGGGVEESGFAWASKKKPKSRLKKGTIITLLLCIPIVYLNFVF